MADRLHALTTELRSDKAHVIGILKSNKREMKYHEQNGQPLNEWTKRSRYEWQKISPRQVLQKKMLVQLYGEKIA
jgi:hypothetical protein